MGEDVSPMLLFDESDESPFSRFKPLDIDQLTAR